MVATVLAIAGLNRLGKQASARAVLDISEMLPAVAQGAIGIECRGQDRRLVEALDRINHAETHLAVTLEREFLTVLDGSCKTPIGGYARRTGDTKILFEGCALSPDGKIRFDVRREELARTPEEARAIGRSAGEELLARAGRNFFQV
jgi:hydroxymethylbilane synthase